MYTTAPEHTISPRLLVADDHMLVAQGVCQLLAERYPHVVAVASGEELITRVVQGEVDLVIADISMGGISGIEALRHVRAAGSQVPFLFLTMHGDHRIAAEAIRSGARGYLLKCAAGDELVRAIGEVLQGRSFVSPTIAGPALCASEAAALGLTDKQRCVLRYVAQGLRSKQIAYELGISVRTVESHKYAIMQIMSVHGTVELVRKAERLGLVSGFGASAMTA